MTPFLRVDGVARHFTRRTGVVHALDRVSFDVSEGEFLSIVGPSGCGKTTLLRIIAGLLPPTEGRVTIADREVSGPTEGMGIVYQRPVLLPWRTVLSNVLLAAEIQTSVSEPMRARALELLARVGLSGFEDAYPSQLSGGMQQRAALCRALVTEPALLLMDEPFAGLDAITRERMGLLLHRVLRQQRRTVVFITHGIMEAVFLSHEVIVMTARPGRLARRIRVDLPEYRTLDLLGLPRFSEQAQAIREEVLSHSEDT